MRVNETNKESRGLDEHGHALACFHLAPRNGPRLVHDGRLKEQTVAVVTSISHLVGG